MLKAVIIDDEPNAREKLQLLLERYCTDVSIMGSAKDVEEGLAAIRLHAPDLVFLDIEMPVWTGFDLLKELEQIDFGIIFTTAHDHYAIKAIKFSALDYLLKPIDLDQLKEAVQKAAERKAEKNSVVQYRILTENLEKQHAPMEQLAVPAQTGMIFIRTGDIVYCEADSNYTKIFLQNGQKIVSSRTLKEYEELLADNGFIRIHHSHLINKNHVREYIKGEGGQVIMKDGMALTVSRRKKEEVIAKLKG
jgi:two-component system, LytTR family, response regulator